MCSSRDQYENRRIPRECATSSQSVLGYYNQPRPCQISEKEHAEYVSKDDKESEEGSKMSSYNDIRTQHNTEKGSPTTVSSTDRSICRVEVYSQLIVIKRNIKRQHLEQVHIEIEKAGI
jgi:hypothetical protein